MTAFRHPEMVTIVTFPGELLRLTASSQDQKHRRHWRCQPIDCIPNTLKDLSHDMVPPDVIMRRMVEVVVCRLMSGLGNWATSESTAIQSTEFAGVRQIIAAVQRFAHFLWRRGRAQRHSSARRFSPRLPNKLAMPQEAAIPLFN
jgi:hypothetical protein